MKYVTSRRRQVIMTCLLALAVIGAAMRYAAPNPSLARDIGTLLLVMWLPAVGNLIAFLVRQWAMRKARRNGFDPAQPFTLHVVARLSPIEGGAPALPPGECRCTVVVGHEGFTARSAAPLLQLLDGGPRDLPLELLRPALALPRLSPGTRLQLLAGRAAIAQGTVERVAA